MSVSMEGGFPRLFSLMRLLYPGLVIIIKGSYDKTINDPVRNIGKERKNVLMKKTLLNDRSKVEKITILIAVSYILI
jgi:hypothetical protein